MIYYLPSIWVDLHYGDSSLLSKVFTPERPISILNLCRNLPKLILLTVFLITCNTFLQCKREIIATTFCGMSQTHTHPFTNKRKGNKRNTGNPTCSQFKRSFANCELPTKANYPFQWVSFRVNKYFTILKINWTKSQSSFGFYWILSQNSLVLKSDFTGNKSAKLTGKKNPTFPRTFPYCFDISKYLLWDFIVAIRIRRNMVSLLAYISYQQV